MHFRGLMLAFSISLSVVACSRPSNVVRLGAILSLTGSAAQYGQWTRNGAELAVDEINASGGIAGRGLALIVEDDATAPVTAVSALRRLIDVSQVTAVIGPITSSNVLAVAPVANERRVLLLTPCASSPKITSAGDFIFRNWPSDTYEGAAMARFLHDRGMKRIAILAMNNEYGLGVRDVFVNRSQQLGITPIASLTFDQDATDYRAQIVRLLEVQPDVVYAPGHAKEVARFLRQARQLGLLARVTSSVAFEAPDVFQIAGPSAEDVYYTAPAFNPHADEPRVARFQRAYLSRFGSEPEVFAAHAYDAIRILAGAIQTAGTDSTSLRDALYATRGFPGVTGLTTFDSNGDVVKPVAIKYVKDQHFLVLMTLPGAL